MKTSLEMRLEVKDFRVSSYDLAKHWQSFYEAMGFFVSFVREGSGYRVYYWY
jgi:hypothetical protein